MPTTMKAIQLHEFGGPEVLRYATVPVPELKPGEVLVRVDAVGINPPDSYLRDGYEHEQLPAEMRPSVAVAGHSGVGRVGRRRGGRDGCAGLLRRR